jgi:GDSL-like Lipase/Acylhydrolase family
VAEKTERHHPLKSLALNAALVVGSLALYFLICELVVFRFVLKASDVPANDFVDGVVRYAPEQSGVWRVRNEIAARFAINAQGWNSGVGDYHVERRSGVARIAMVGDSYVEALQVDHHQSVAERLMVELAADLPGVEAYRFAISGAPLSQYLHMVERAVGRYRPDWIVVLMVHNDFDESFTFVPGRYTSSFLKLRVEGDRVVEEIAPTRWQPGLAELLRRTATARYLYYRWQVRPNILKSWFVPSARADTARFGVNIDVDAVLRQMPQIRAATDHVFGRLEEVSRRSGAKLLLVMDGDRAAIYAGEAPGRPFALTAMAADLARTHGIAFLDLTAAFAADWRASHRRFEHLSDAHWNEHGHAVAARAIAGAMRRP